MIEIEDGEAVDGVEGDMEEMEDAGELLHKEESIQAVVLTVR
jgi:hypothetical protein